jgi:hypothetical protein
MPSSFFRRLWKDTIRDFRPPEQPPDPPSSDAMRWAIELAYRHIDRYGALGGSSEETASQQAALDALRPYVDFRGML